MYYANNTIKGETITETIFEFVDGEQTSTKKLEYKGKVYNGKLILHTNGNVAVCIDDKEHYAYKNKDTDEIVSGTGTCLYDGTTGDFSSNILINDLRGQVISATQIEENGDNALVTVPKEGHYDTTSKISVPIETIKNNITSLNDSYTIEQFTELGTKSANNNGNGTSSASITMKLDKGIYIVLGGALTHENLSLSITPGTAACTISQNIILEGNRAALSIFSVDSSGTVTVNCNSTKGNWVYTSVGLYKIG